MTTPVRTVALLLPEILAVIAAVLGVVWVVS